MEDTMDTPDTTGPNPEAQSATRPGRSAITFLVVTAFLNTMGAGILSPVLPFIVQRYISNQHTLALAVGWLVAAYALCQFVASARVCWLLIYRCTINGRTGLRIPAPIVFRKAVTTRKVMVLRPGLVALCASGLGPVVSGVSIVSSITRLYPSQR